MIPYLSRREIQAEQSTEPKCLVHLKVCHHFDVLAQRCAGKREAGGIVIGRYRGPHLEVTEFTSPGPNDIRGRFHFVKQDRSHARQARKSWKASGRTATNVGEWHTHPAGGISPSSQDEQTWLSLSKSTKRSMVFFLIAPGDWGVFSVSALAAGSSIKRLVARQRGLSGVVFGEVRRG